MYLGLDYGTSEIKALLLDEHANIVCTHGLPLSIQRPYPQWSEQSAAEWWQVTNDLMAKMREKAGEAWYAVKAIGLSGQMHGAVLLGKDNQVLRPVILWNDTRSAEECAELEAAVPDLHRHHRQFGHARFYRPEIIVGEKTRAGNFRSDGVGIAAERLHPLFDDR